jgi:hypothetical protein
LFEADPPPLTVYCFGALVYSISHMYMKNNMVTSEHFTYLKMMTFYVTYVQFRVSKNSYKFSTAFLRPTYTHYTFWLRIQFHVLHEPFGATVYELIKLRLNKAHQNSYYCRHPQKQIFCINCEFFSYRPKGRKNNLKRQVMGNSIFRAICWQNWGPIYSSIHMSSWFPLEHRASVKLFVSLQFLNFIDSR